MDKTMSHMKAPTHNDKLQQGNRLFRMTKKTLLREFPFPTWMTKTFLKEFPFPTYWMCKYLFKVVDRMSTSWQNQQNSMCAQRRLRSAWAFAQSDQSLRCPHEERLGPSLPIERIANTLIRLGGCPGWSESSLGAHAILLVLSWGGSKYDFFYKSQVPGQHAHRHSTVGYTLVDSNYPAHYHSLITVFAGYTLVIT